MKTDNPFSPAGVPSPKRMRGGGGAHSRESFARGKSGGEFDGGLRGERRLSSSTKRPLAVHTSANSTSMSSNNIINTPIPEYGEEEDGLGEAPMTIAVALSAAERAAVGAVLRTAELVVQVKEEEWKGEGVEEGRERWPEAPTLTSFTLSFASNSQESLAGPFTDPSSAVRGLAARKGVRSTGVLLSLLPVLPMPPPDDDDGAARRQWAERITLACEEGEGERERDRTASSSSSTPSSSPSDVLARKRREVRVHLTRLHARLTWLGLRTRRVRMDGNCLFRAIAWQLLGAEALHDVVRAHVAAYMRRVRAAKFNCLFETADLADAYFAAVERDGTWGDELALRAASDSLFLTLHVLSSEEENYYIVYRPSEDAPPPPGFLVDPVRLVGGEAARRRRRRRGRGDPPGGASLSDDAARPASTSSSFLLAAISSFSAGGGLNCGRNIAKVKSVAAGHQPSLGPPGEDQPPVDVGALQQVAQAKLQGSRLLGGVIHYRSESSLTTAGVGGGGDFMASCTSHDDAARDEFAEPPDLILHDLEGANPPVGIHGGSLTPCSLPLPPRPPPLQGSLTAQSHPSGGGLPAPTRDPGSAVDDWYPGHGQSGLSSLLPRPRRLLRPAREQHRPATAAEERHRLVVKLANGSYATTSAVSNDSLANGEVWDEDGERLLLAVPDRYAPSSDALSNTSDSVLLSLSEGGERGQQFVFEPRKEPFDVFLAYLHPYHYDALEVEHPSPPSPAAMKESAGREFYPFRRAPLNPIDPQLNI